MTQIWEAALVTALCAATMLVSLYATLRPGSKLGRVVTGSWDRIATATHWLLAPLFGPLERHATRRSAYADMALAEKLTQAGAHDSATQLAEAASRRLRGD